MDIFSMPCNSYWFHHFLFLRLYSCGVRLLEGCPSWHHQAVRSIEGTNLIVSATTETCGITMVEAIERTDKEFALGLQFHPEAAYVKYMDKAQNMNGFMDTDDHGFTYEHINHILNFHAQ